MKSEDYYENKALFLIEKGYYNDEQYEELVQKLKNADRDVPPSTGPNTE